MTVPRSSSLPPFEGNWFGVLKEYDAFEQRPVLNRERIIFTKIKSAGLSAGGQKAVAIELAGEVVATELMERSWHIGGILSHGHASLLLHYLGTDPHRLSYGAYILNGDTASGVFRGFWSGWDHDLRAQLVGPYVFSRERNWDRVREHHQDWLRQPLHILPGCKTIKSFDRPPEEERPKVRKKIFVSYSHKDRRCFDEFKMMLTPAIRDGIIDVWDDTLIEPSAKWNDEIEAALSSARVAVLLVSPHFLASEYITKKELLPLLKQAQDRGVKIFWLCLRACDCTKIADYQAAHDVFKPLDQLDKPRRLKVLREVCAKLIRLVQSP